MAETNITAGTYRTSLDQKVANALEMATEIKAESTRQYCLASVLTDQLEADTTAHGLAEVLEERLTECGQMYRLIECLEEIKKEVCNG